MAVAVLFVFWVAVCTSIQRYSRQQKDKSRLVIDPCAYPQLTRTGCFSLFLLRVPGMLYLVIWSFIGLVFAGLVACSYYMRKTSDRWDEEEI